MSITTTASNQHCGNKSWSTLHLEMHETQDQHGAQIMCFQAWERKRVFCSCFSPKYDQNSFCENLNKNKMTVLFCSSCLRSFHLVTILSALQQELFKAIFKAHRRKHMDVTSLQLNTLCANVQVLALIWEKTGLEPGTTPTLTIFKGRYQMIDSLSLLLL